MNLITRLFRVLGFASVASAEDVVLREGDCWSYASRSGEESSFLVIRKIEHLPNAGEVAHVSIFGLHIKNPSAPSGYAGEIAHLPIAVESLRRFLKQKLQKSAPECDWQSGYKMFQEAEGGAFTEPVSECVKLVEETLARGHTKA